jgi:hypothetical protein
MFNSGPITLVKRALYNNDGNSLFRIQGNFGYPVVIFLFLAASYSIYFIFDEYTIGQLGREDNFFENLTALLFLFAALFFLLAFRYTRNLFYLALSILFLFGAGEEISWGQRIFGFDPPDYVARHNVQNEFNLHNMEFFNEENYDHKPKTGLAKLVRINFLYKLFWLTYGAVIPLCAVYFSSVRSLAEKIKLPVPPVSIGIFFVINWLTFRIGLSFLLPDGKVVKYYETMSEISECVSAFIFMLLAFYFYSSDKYQYRDLK